MSKVDADGWYVSQPEIQEVMFHMKPLSVTTRHDTLQTAKGSGSCPDTMSYPCRGGMIVSF